MAMLVVVAAFFQTAVRAQEAGARSFATELAGQLKPPGLDEHFVRPSGLFVDDLFHEVLVTDAGRNRVVIFDDGGHYKFEFGGRDIFSAPLDVVAETDGTILVLGSTPGHRGLFRFDFDGAYLGELTLTSPDGGDAFLPYALDLSDDGSLVVTERGGPWVCFYRNDGTLVRSFRLRDGNGHPLSSEVVIGPAHVDGGYVFVPISSRGTVYVYDIDGTFIRAIGRKGSDVGELAFPVDVATSRKGALLVLDKHRFKVCCFDVDGEFLGEFGGRGARPGTYYHPTLLAADSMDRIYIGQVFQNRVDICRFPEPIRERLDDNRVDMTNEWPRYGDPGPLEGGGLIAWGGDVFEHMQSQEAFPLLEKSTTLFGGE